MSALPIPYPASYPVTLVDIPQGCPATIPTCHDCVEWSLAPSLYQSPCDGFRLGWLLVRPDRVSVVATNLWADAYGIPMPEAEPMDVADYCRMEANWRMCLVWIPAEMRDRMAAMLTADGRQFAALLNPGDITVWTCDIGSGAPCVSVPVVSQLAMEGFGSLQKLLMPVYASSNPPGAVKP